MAREDLHFRLRIPEELKAHIEAAAEKNRRSMTAEIVSRLEDFDPLVERLKAAESLAAERLQEAHEWEMRYVALQSENEGYRLEAKWAEEKKHSIPRDQTLYLAIDAEGKPISWQEIWAHINAITHAGELDINRIDARIFEPELISNSKREQAWSDLVEYYRERGGRAPEEGDDEEGDEA